jgi:hypothetical protein
VLNPYIDLLKHLCKFEKVLLNGTSFSQIVDMYGSEISEADLRGKGTLGELNLVRNPLFYKFSMSEISDYLTWQHAIQNSNQIPSDSKLEIIYANIVATAGNTANLKDKLTYTKLQSSNFAYEVQPLQKYKEIIKVGFKIDGDKPKVVQATDEEVSAILTKITSADKAKKLLTYLVNLYRVTNLKLLSSLLTEPFGEKVKANRNATLTSFEEDREFDTLINTAAKKYSQAQLKTLFAKLTEIAEL